MLHCKLTQTSTDTRVMFRALTTLSCSALHYLTFIVISHMLFNIFVYIYIIFGNHISTFVSVLCGIYVTLLTTGLKSLYRHRTKSLPKCWMGWMPYYSSFYIRVLCISHWQHNVLVFQKTWHHILFQHWSGILCHYQYNYRNMLVMKYSSQITPLTYLIHACILW